MPRILSLLALLLLPSITLSHSGRLDANGGHHKDGQYHCHKEPCFSRQQVEAATKDAEPSNTAYSRVYDRDDWPQWQKAHKIAGAYQGLQLEKLRSKHRNKILQVLTSMNQILALYKFETFEGKRSSKNVLFYLIQRL